MEIGSWPLLKAFNSLDDAKKYHALRLEISAQTSISAHNRVQLFLCQTALRKVGERSSA
jgi:hypothetical protein